MRTSGSRRNLRSWRPEGRWLDDKTLLCWRLQQAARTSALVYLENCNWRTRTLFQQTRGLQLEDRSSVLMDVEVSLLRTRFRSGGDCSWQIESLFLWTQRTVDKGQELCSWDQARTLPRVQEPELRTVKLAVRSDIS